MTQRILCVDDEPVLHEILDLIFDEKLTEYQLLVARGADEALKLMQEPLSLCLVDVRMPGVDGLELTRQIRARQPDCPIIVFSAQDDPSLEAKARQAGADTFVKKPFEVDTLLDAVRDLLFSKAKEAAPKEAASAQ